MRWVYQITWPCIPRGVWKWRQRFSTDWAKRSPPKHRSSSWMMFWGGVLMPTTCGHSMTRLLLLWMLIYSVLAKARRKTIHGFQNTFRRDCSQDWSLAATTTQLLYAWSPFWRILVNGDPQNFFWVEACGDPEAYILFGWAVYPPPGASQSHASVLRGLWRERTAAQASLPTTPGTNVCQGKVSLWLHHHGAKT